MTAVNRFRDLGLAGSKTVDWRPFIRFHQTRGFYNIPTSAEATCVVFLQDQQIREAKGNLRCKKSSGLATTPSERVYLQ